MPTISPDILRKWWKSGTNGCCHSKVMNGMIYFFPDSTHDLSGKTIELPSFTESKIRYWTDNPDDYLINK